MSKKKKIIITLVTILIIAALITGGIFAYMWYQRNNLTASVESVENLIWYYEGESMNSYGMVTNDFYQDVFLMDQHSIAEVYVEEGQEVAVGDPLLAYDMTMTELELEMQELEIESIKNDLVMEKRELERWRTQVPIVEIEEVPEPEEPVEEEPEVEIPKKDEATGAYNYISGDTNSRKAKTSGKGTPENPYVILCMPGAYVEGAYLNKLASSEKLICVRLQVINPKTNKSVKDKYWEISSQQLASTGMTFEEDARWSVETKQPVYDEEYGDIDDVFEPEIEEPEIEEPEGYTAAEIAAGIKECEKRILDLDLEKRKAELHLEQMKKVSEDGVVTATVAGVVKSVGDIDNPPQDGSAFLTVSGSEGLYVSGSLSELMLEQVQIGQTIYANSWETGMSFEATIQEISPYPTENNNSWGEGNPNVSYYPYVAYIANPEGLKNGEYVDLTMTAMNNNVEADESSAIYIMKAYVREENGRSYVLIADENSRLKKQYVETGKTIYGEAIEIKSGLSREDLIAFPYGKTAKEGIKAEEGADYGMYY